MPDETARARATRALQRHLPGLVDVSLTEIGGGLDNTCFAHDELVVRVAREHRVTDEARLLAVVGPRVSLPVPVPRFVDEADGVLAYPRLPGRPLLGLDPPPGLARALGRFLRELHAIDVATVEGFVPCEPADPAAWLVDLEGPPELLRRVHASVPPPGSQRALTHADLGAEHLLAQDGRCTGVIDWSDAAITDPALDFARLYRDFGPAFLAEALDAHGGLPDADAAARRVTFFARVAALEDLVYGEAHGLAAYAEAARRALSWLF